MLHLNCIKKQPYCKENHYNIVVKTMSFGKWLSAKRREAGLTQGQLARKAGISTSYVSTLERQQPHSITDAPPQPAIDVVESLAKALNENLDDARLAAGYAPKNAADNYEILEGVFVSFDERKFSKAEQKRLLSLLETVVLGFKARQDTESTNPKRFQKFSETETEPHFQTKEEVKKHLMADKNLSPETAESLYELFEEAYDSNKLRPMQEVEAEVGGKTEVSGKKLKVA